VRIAHIDTEKGWRGGEQQVVSLCEALAALGHENVVVLRKNSALQERLKDKGTSFIFSQSWGEWDILSANNVRSKLRKKNVEIVHAHTAHGVALAAAATLGTTIPIVATRRLDFHLCKNTFSRWKYGRVQKIIAVSNCIQKILIEDGIPQEKISMIPDGVDFRRFDSIIPVSKRELGFPEDSILIGQVAALVPHKDPTTFVRAIAELHKNQPMVRAVILGEGELRSVIESEVKYLGLENVVRLLGFRRDVLNHLAGFDLFCLSSVEEGLGSSILDAMALRVPVVATNAGGIPEMIKHEVTGYLAESGNPHSLSLALERALTERTKNHYIIENAFRKCREFDISRTASDVEQIYELLVGTFAASKGPKGILNMTPDADSARKRTNANF